MSIQSKIRIKLNIVLSVGMIAVFSVVISTGSLVLAQSPSPLPPILGTQTQQLTDSEKIDRITKLALSEIEKRQSALDKLSTKINKNTKITTEDKQAMIAEVQNNTNELKNIRRKIEAETYLGSLRLERKSIKYLRISGVFIPKAHGELASYSLGAAVQKITAILEKVQKKADGASDTDKTKVNSLIVSAKSKIESAKSNNDNALLQFKLVTPQNYPVGSKAALQKGESYLDNAKKDLKSAGEDIKQIVSILKPK